MLGHVSDQVHGPDKDTERSYITMQAAAARTKGDVVRIGSSAVGLLDVSLASNTESYRVAVADQNIASGDRGRYQLTGRCTITTPSITTVAGEAVDVHTGAVRASTATAEKPNGVVTNNDFAVVLTAATTATSHDVFLYGDTIVGQT
jgi:hypothetical protein